MNHKSLVSTAVTMSLALVLVPLLGRAQGAQPGAGQPNQEQSRIDTEMMTHQRAMDIILWRLQMDFQDVIKSKDDNGYVHNMAAVKTYKGDLEALSVVARQHKQLAADYERWCGQSFTTDYAHWCGPDVKQNEMTDHQQRMKAILSDLSDTFNTYVTVDDHTIEGSPNKIQDALNAHRVALNKFADVIKDHDGAISQMTANGAESIPMLPLSDLSLLQLPEKQFPEKR